MSLRHLAVVEEGLSVIAYGRGFYMKLFFVSLQVRAYLLGT